MYLFIFYILYIYISTFSSLSRLCLHQRDFNPATPIYDSVSVATESSSKSVIMLSRSYLRYKYLSIYLFINKYMHIQYIFLTISICIVCTYVCLYYLYAMYIVLSSYLSINHVSIYIFVFIHLTFYSLEKKHLLFTYHLFSSVISWHIFYVHFDYTYVCTC